MGYTTVTMPPSGSGKERPEKERTMQLTTVLSVPETIGTIVKHWRRRLIERNIKPAIGNAGAA